MKLVTLIRVRGIVQGVGFRPFVWRLANDMGAAGSVQNDNDGVLIKLQNVDPKIFISRLTTEAPIAATITAIEITESSGDFSNFEIIATSPSPGTTAISPDLATCPECLVEIFNPHERRHHYAFTNCTNCGPRFSIIRHLPYDRANTAMADFLLCAACAAEYNDPNNRRFHAEPLACPTCGPKLWLEVKDERHEGLAAIKMAAEMLSGGSILAIKGIGGFHLGGDAGNEAVVRRMRQTKGRKRKPFALMASSLEQIKLYTDISQQAENQLLSPSAPIVLLPTNETVLASSIAPGQTSLGFMLPYSPLHHLLMAEMTRPIVLTSANSHDEPQVSDNATARVELADMADGFLMHEREITQQIDDSVVKPASHGPILLRRARGFAPAPIILHKGFADFPATLGLGADLKSTITALSGSEATVSQHLGDLATPRSRAAYEKSLKLFVSLNGFKPGAIGIDWHPDFYSTQVGNRFASTHDLPIVPVQHHHAHIASVMAENNIAPDTSSILGIALDGIGLGEGGALWGGEFLSCDFKQFSRLNHFPELPLLGADISAREPWRCLGAVWALAKRDPEELKYHAGFEVISQNRLQQFSAALKNPRLITQSSAIGRWFDAFSALCGICVAAQDYEAEAPQLLEALAGQVESSTHYETSGLDLIPIFEQALKELDSGQDKCLLARKFHNTLSLMISTEAIRLCANHGLGTVALSGGVLNNSLLREGIMTHLREAKLSILFNHQVPAGDGGISLGQATVAAIRRG